MRKFAIITEKDNSVLLKKLIEAGFTTQCAGVGYYNQAQIININFNCDRNIHWSSEMSKNIMQFYIDERACFITTKQALAMLAAGEIDGQLKVYEVAPEGKRLVTDKERIDNPYPEGVEVYWIDCEYPNGGWQLSNGEACWDHTDCLSTGKAPAAWAVPLDFTFDTEMDRKKREVDEQIKKLKTEFNERVSALQDSVNEM